MVEHPGHARTIEEMQFAVSITPCERCRELTSPGWELFGGNGRYALQGICPLCDAQRVHEFVTLGDPSLARIGRFDLGPGSSKTIAPEQFLQALDALPPFPPNPAALSRGMRLVIVERVVRGLTCVTELIKLAPLDFSPIPKTSDPRLNKKWLEGEYLRLRKLLPQYAPPCTIDDERIAAHDAYVSRGAKGEGRLQIVDADLRGEIYPSVKWPFVEIERSRLREVTLAESSLQFALLRDADLSFANLRATLFDGALIDRTRFLGANLGTANFDGATLRGSFFSRSDLERAFLARVRASDTRFDGARLEGATLVQSHFERCSFVSASLGKYLSSDTVRSDEAEFVDCDFTGAKWNDRDLAGATFVRCKLAGGTGTPAAKGVRLVDCDLDEAAFASLR